MGRVEEERERKYTAVLSVVVDSSFVELTPTSSVCEAGFELKLGCKLEFGFWALGLSVGFECGSEVHLSVSLTFAF